MSVVLERMARRMSYEAQSHDRHQLELLMTTVFTCRSVVKYGLTLGEGQKKELLADIDTSLEVLRSYLLTGPSMPTNTASLQAQPANFSSVLSLSEDAIVPGDVVTNNNERQILQDLYKMYHAYMSVD